MSDWHDKYNRDERFYRDHSPRNPKPYSPYRAYEEPQKEDIKRPPSPRKGPEGHFCNEINNEKERNYYKYWN